MEIRFIGKDAKGDGGGGGGGALDCYLAFSPELCNRFGKIIHHVFIQLGFFPFTFLGHQLNRLFLVKLARKS